MLNMLYLQRVNFIIIFPSVSDNVLMQALASQRVIQKIRGAEKCDTSVMDDTL